MQLRMDLGCGVLGHRVSVNIHFLTYSNTLLLWLEIFIVKTVVDSKGTLLLCGDDCCSKRALLM